MYTTSWSCRALIELVLLRNSGVGKTCIVLCFVCSQFDPIIKAMPIFLDSILPAWISILISVTLILAFGEIIPQVVCSQYGLSVGAKLAILVRLLFIIILPIAYPISKLTLSRQAAGHLMKSYLYYHCTSLAHGLSVFHERKSTSKDKLKKETSVEPSKETRGEVKSETKAETEAAEKKTEGDMSASTTKDTDNASASPKVPISTITYL